MIIDRKTVEMALSALDGCYADCRASLYEKQKAITALRTALDAEKPAEVEPDVASKMVTLAKEMLSDAASLGKDIYADKINRMGMSVDWKEYAHRLLALAATHASTPPDAAAQIVKLEANNKHLIRQLSIATNALTQLARNNTHSFAYGTYLVASNALKEIAK